MVTGTGDMLKIVILVKNAVNYVIISQIRKLRYSIERKNAQYGQKRCYILIS